MNLFQCLISKYIISHNSKSLECECAKHGYKYTISSYIDTCIKLNKDTKAEFSKVLGKESEIS